MNTETQKTMTKKLILITVAMLFLFNLFSQSDYFTDCQRPYATTFDGNYMFYAEVGDYLTPINEHKIYKVDISQQTLTKELVKSNINGLRSIVFFNDSLYYLSINGDLRKIPAYQNAPAIFLQNVTGSSSYNTRAYKMTLHNEALYITLFDQGKIVKVPLNNPTTSTDIISNLNLPGATAFIGNEMYYLDFINGNGSRLYKINLNENNPSPIIVENTLLGGSHIVALGEYIYTTHTGSGSRRRISKTNTTGTLPAFEELVISNTDANSQYLTIYNGYAYVSTYQVPSRIQRYALCQEDKIDTNATACGSFIWNGTEYTESGTYADTLSNADGCDSIVTLNLTINKLPNTNTVLEENTIISLHTNGTYQWINCDDNSIINGANEIHFTPTKNGNYAIIVTENNCSDTSECVNINTIGINGVFNLDYIKVSPNPSNGIFYIELKHSNDYQKIELYSITGKLLYAKKVNAITQKLDLTKYQKGIYFLNIKGKDKKNNPIKIIKN